MKIGAFVQKLSMNKLKYMYTNELYNLPSFGSRLKKDSAHGQQLQCGEGQQIIFHKWNTNKFTTRNGSQQSFENSQLCNESA